MSNTIFLIAAIIAIILSLVELWGVSHPAFLIAVIIAIIVALVGLWKISRPQRQRMARALQKSWQRLATSRQRLSHHRKKTPQEKEIEIYQREDQ